MAGAGLFGHGDLDAVDDFHSVAEDAKVFWRDLNVAMHERARFQKALNDPIVERSQAQTAFASFQEDVGAMYVFATQRDTVFKEANVRHSDEFSRAQGVITKLRQQLAIASVLAGGDAPQRRPCSRFSVDRRKMPRISETEKYRFADRERQIQFSREPQLEDLKSRVPKLEGNWFRYLDEIESYCLQAPAWAEWEVEQTHPTGLEVYDMATDGGSFGGRA